MIGWKQKLAESQRLAAAPPVLGNENGSTGNGIAPAAKLSGATSAAAETDYYISEDFFANWDNWPQVEMCDFGEYLNDFAA